MIGPQRPYRGTAAFHKAMRRDEPAATTPINSEGLAHALDDLQQAEAEYRLMHDRHGDGSSATERAWDRMRLMGDKARDALNAPVPTPVIDGPKPSRETIEKLGRLEQENAAGLHAVRNTLLGSDAPTIEGEGLRGPSPDGRRMAETENTGSGRKPDQQVPGSKIPSSSQSLSNGDEQ